MKLKTKQVKNSKEIQRLVNRICTRRDSKIICLPFGKYGESYKITLSGKVVYVHCWKS
jgi:hypothetical protein